jgi:hypothetical protein
MKEFEKERAAIVHQIALVRGFQINAAEEWGARSPNPEKLYRFGVQECHIYVGLFGNVYSAATQGEYEEASGNPYRQKLIYLKRSRNIDPRLAELIKLFRDRHRPYIFTNLWDLLPRVVDDLDWAVQQILDHTLERYTEPPVAHSGETNIALEAWKNKQHYLAALYGHDAALTVDSLEAIRGALQEKNNKSRHKFGRVLSRIIGR